MIWDMRNMRSLARSGRVVIVLPWTRRARVGALGGGRACVLRVPFARSWGWLAACSLLLGVVSPERVFAQQAAAGRGAKPKYPRISLAAGYELDAGWFLNTKDRTWGAVSGLAVGAGGRVWLFHRGETPVEVLTPEGELLRSWGKGDFKEPHQVRIDPAGDVWLVDSGLHIVRRYSPEGKLRQTLGESGVPGEDKTHFNRPTDVAVTPNGDVYVADGYGNNRVVHFDAAGHYLAEWGGLGVGKGQFSLPHSIALDSHGRLYVADRNNARVQIFDLAGRFLDEWRDLITPWHIVVAPGDKIVVCGSSPMRWGKLGILGLPLGVPPKDQLVMIFNPEGRVERIATFPLGKQSGELEWVHGMALDAAGNLYLGDIQGKRARKFNLLPADDGPRDIAGPAAKGDAAVVPAARKP